VYLEFICSPVCAGLNNQREKRESKRRSGRVSIFCVRVVSVVLFTKWKRRASFTVKKE